VPAYDVFSIRLWEEEGTEKSVLIFGGGLKPNDNE
jgi:hypothetical protein